MGAFFTHITLVAWASPRAHGYGRKGSQTRSLGADVLFRLGTDRFPDDLFGPPMLDGDYTVIVRFLSALFYTCIPSLLAFEIF